MKGGSRKGYKQKTGQVFQGYEAYKPPFNKANFKPSYSKTFQSNSSNSNNNPGRSKQTIINHKKWARGGKTKFKAHAATTKGKLKTKLLELQQTLPNQSRDR
jgi:hypothetical protein